MSSYEPPLNLPENRGPRLRSVRRHAGICFAVFVTLHLPNRPASAVSSAREIAAVGRAEAAAREGDMEKAAAAWQEAAARAARANETGAQIDALTHFGAACQALGRQRLAVESLNQARELAEKAHDRPRLAGALEGMGVAQTFSHQAQFAEEHLQKALALARQSCDRTREASILNNLGILHAAQGKLEPALQEYAEAIHLAQVQSDPILAVKAQTNLAETAANNGSFERARAANRAAFAAVERLEDSHDKAFGASRCGKTWELIFTLDPAHPQELRVEALKNYELASSVAETIGDRSALSFALGSAGHLYEQEKKYNEALTLTRRAAFLAQETQSPNLVYQWAWQTGRIDRAEDRRDQAIADYRCAVRNLDGIRNDLSARLGNANAHSSFREAVGDVYFELADLLLQRADGAHGEEDLKELLRQAQGVCEDLKSVELEDYFQDDCVNLLKARTKAVENLAQGAAVVYLVPLRDRTEIIVSTEGKLQRVKTPVAAADLIETVRAFRVHLETRTTEEYLLEAHQLYDWLIRPLEPILSKSKVDTLVFVPDGALRTIPMAALHDGTKFLIEKYALAVTPGLTLMEPKPIKRAAITIMTNALTEEVHRDGQTYPALPYVKEEIAKIQQLYGGKMLLNSSFREANVRDALDKEPFSVVHIASHGEFCSEANKTFVLTYDDRLGLDALEQLIRPAQLRDQPVELLCLSACQTAAGDDRAALGLAGVAVKAGARSALATLWYVNDEASTKLVSYFYEQLRQDDQLSKARALQRAQVLLLSDPRTSHPCLWAPYLLIGNWL